MQTKSIFENLYTSKYFSNLPDFKEKKTQAFITIALTIFALSFFGIFAINPTISTIANLQKQKEDNTLIEKKLDDKRENLAKLSTTYTTLEADLPYVFAAIPKNPDIPNLTGQIYSLGKTANITINRIQTTKVELTKKQEGTQDYSSFIFTIDASGSYPNLKQFIDSLADFNRIITLDSIAINKSSDENTGLLMIIQGKAYFKL